MPVRSQVHAPNGEISQWIAEFLIDWEVGNLSPNTIRYYTNCLRNFALICDEIGAGCLEEVTAREFRQFMRWLHKRGHNPGGIHAHHRICKTLFRWWELETSPRAYQDIFRKVKAPKISLTTLPPVSLEDVAALVTTCGWKTCEPNPGGWFFTCKVKGSTNTMTRISLLRLWPKMPFTISNISALQIWRAFFL